MGLENHGEIRETEAVCDLCLQGALRWAGAVEPSLLLQHTSTETLQPGPGLPVRPPQQDHLAPLSSLMLSPRPGSLALTAVSQHPKQPHTSWGGLTRFLLPATPFPFSPHPSGPKHGGSSSETNP